MEIVNVKISDLKFAEYNPRQMTEKQAEDLTKSIKEFGIVDPIIVNSNPDRFNVIIGGHQRVKIASNLNLNEVPVYYINLDRKQEETLNIRLNKNVGDWDWDMLANFERDYLIDIGFNEDEIDFHFNIEKDENFSLPDGDRAPFQQMTFTLADKQAEEIKNAMKEISDNIGEYDNFGNENSNGNALYYIIKKWTELKN
jgi:hypothetical protein